MRSIYPSLAFAVVCILHACFSFRCTNKLQGKKFSRKLAADDIFDDEPIYSVSYDPLGNPNQLTFERDLEDLLIERGNRFYDEKMVRCDETCYLVGLDDKSRWTARKRKTHLTNNGDDDGDDDGDDKMSEMIEKLMNKVGDTDDDFDDDEREYITSDLSMIDDIDGTMNDEESTPTVEITSINRLQFSMEESLAELSELAGAAGLTVVGSTYQRVTEPNIQYYIGAGKTRDIHKNMQKLKCTCVIFDTELTPSQQKNLEIVFNEAVSTNPKQKNKKSKDVVKVVDRTALILDIFAQHAKTKEGQLQVRLALLTYRLPRLTNLWTHLERQSAGSKGTCSGGVGLRGPGEKQLESDKREMKAKICALNKAIKAVQRHRSVHRSRRRRMGLPVVALVGYTNSGKSTLLNSLTNSAEVYTADMLFATLDPTTRLVRMAGLKNPDLLITDTVGFIQKLPTHLIAAFRATLEELDEADVLLHVTDISNDDWRKQEASVLTELHNMGLSNKPLITVWNKVDLVPERLEYLKLEATKRASTICLSARSGEGIESLTGVMEAALSSQMESFSVHLPYGSQTSSMIDTLHRVAVVDEITYGDSTVFIRASAPAYLHRRMVTWGVDPNSYVYASEYEDEPQSYDDPLEQLDMDLDDLDGTFDLEDLEELDESGRRGAAAVSQPTIIDHDIDWKQLAKGRHSAKQSMGW
jgi:GTP-binding protein HflX